MTIKEFMEKNKDEREINMLDKEKQAEIDNRESAEKMLKKASEKSKLVKKHTTTRVKDERGLEHGLHENRVHYLETEVAYYKSKAAYHKANEELYLEAYNKIKNSQVELIDVIQDQVAKCE